jgi:phosphoesterase RecJ-like protein
LEAHHPKYSVIPGQHLLYNGAFDAEIPLICLDCADLTRIPAPWRTEKPDACIDHHYTNIGFARYNFIDGTASSACEMVYRLLKDFIPIDKEMAAAVYAGLVSDTGGFRFNATSPETLRVASELTALGIPFTEIYTQLVHLRTRTEVKLLARILDRYEPHLNGRLVCACVTPEMYKNLGGGASDATSKDLEGVVEFLLNIRGVEVSALLYAREGDEVKISLRSRKRNVGAVAVRLGGGGHHLAAGAQAHGDMFTIRDQVIALLKQEME